ncbi:MAG TPA: HD domain-containing protein, partial [Fimbriimonas sp.]|nr:HD domain-containing protein [Fimbriimonas sp.]
HPVVYENFGTAMVEVAGTKVEIVTARRESYSRNSRKPVVQPGTYLDDALRRDFTANTLMRSIFTDEIIDPLGCGLADLEAKVLRTPLDPLETFSDDPLRMLRAVRFRWSLGFTPVEGLYEAIRSMRDRLSIISIERMRDEVLKMMLLPDGHRALADLMDLGILSIMCCDFDPMVGCSQGKYHDADVWEHTLKVVANAALLDESLTPEQRVILNLGALFHDIGKPLTRTIDENGDIRFFTHEHVGEVMTLSILRRWKLPNDDAERVARLVKNHMRLGSAQRFSSTAARRVIRDLGEDVELLLRLVDADQRGLKQGLKVFDLQAIRNKIEATRYEQPIRGWESPLDGDEIMALLGIEPGRELGRIKKALQEAVIEGELHPEDKVAASALAKKLSES